MEDTMVGRHGGNASSYQTDPVLSVLFLHWKSAALSMWGCCPASQGQCCTQKGSGSEQGCIWSHPHHACQFLPANDFRCGPAEAAWASIFVLFHLLAKSWTQDYFFRCQQYPVIIPLLTYNCLVAESLPSQQLWTQRWRHLFTQAEVWEQIHSRFGKGWGERGRSFYIQVSQALRQARQSRKMACTTQQCCLKEISKNHTEAVFEFTNKISWTAVKLQGCTLLLSVAILIQIFIL